MNLRDLKDSAVYWQENHLHISYLPNFFNSKDADCFFLKLKSEIEWKQYPITLFGKTYIQPRKIAYHADQGKAYTYSRQILQPKPWNSVLKNLKEHCNQILPANWNAVLLNYYLNGQDSMGWHSDDETELGEHPMIASFSFGTPRLFRFRLKSNPRETRELLLEHGSLLIMHAPTQKYWQHALPKSKKINTERINATFRVIN